MLQNCEVKLTNTHDPQKRSRPAFVFLSGTVGVGKQSVGHVGAIIAEPAVTQEYGVKC